MKKTLGALTLAMIVAQAAPMAASAHTGAAALQHRSTVAAHQRAVLCKDGCYGPNFKPSKLPFEWIFPVW